MARSAPWDALVRGGVTGIEITYSTPDVPRVLSSVAERYGDTVFLGAGTLRIPAHVREAVDAGAQFLRGGLSASVARPTQVGDRDARQRPLEGRARVRCGVPPVFRTL
jgi:hypothetical protein